MGYFSNGLEGEYYQEKYCFKCKHWTDEKGCPVWNIHLLYNYDSHSVSSGILNTFISRSGINNKECEMFIKK